MKVFYNFENVESIKNPIVTTGSFDGVHVGHQSLLSKMREIADEKDGETVLISFHPHPREVLYPELLQNQMIFSHDEKIRCLNEHGLDNLIIVDFNEEFAKLSMFDYVRKYLVEKLNIDTIVFGHDHHFGKNREGDFNYMLEMARYYGFSALQLQVKDVNHISVSSTKIRRTLETGNVDLANKLLGHSFLLDGKVEHGSKLGRKLGFPTANLSLSCSKKLIPPDGVYEISTNYDKQDFSGLLNISRNREINNGHHYLRLHLLNFNKDIYGETITLKIKSKIRNLYRFRNIQSLTRQLSLDASSLSK